jgi:single-strand DNA-binding protein
MASFNKVILMGNLTRDPQLKYLPSQTAVAEFGLAMNRKFRTQQGEDREEVTFVDCAAFGKTADVINQYFTKGKPIFIEGRLKFDSWEDKQGGGKRSRLTVVVENFQFVGGRDGGGGGGGGGGPSYEDHDAGDQSGGGGGGGYQQPRPPHQNRGPQAGGGGGAPQQQRPPQRQQQPEPPFSENQEFKEDDIPF